MAGALRVPYHRPTLTGREIEHVRAAIDSGAIAGDGPFTKKCEAWLEEDTGAARAFLTQSCTSALEMSALLLGIGPGDEVVMPSYTFTSTANAFVLRGAIPVFVDIRPDTLNIDERAIEAALSSKTKAICVVHYAGVGCEMDAIARVSGVPIVEDSAHGCLASYRGRRLGSIGNLGTLSFHETKHVIAGEGGALLVNDPSYVGRAEILWQKGTNRHAFLRKEVEKYSWVDIGSSFLPSEITAAFLWGQLEDANAIKASRLALWQGWWNALAPHEARGILRRPVVPAHCEHNAHMFYVIMPSKDARGKAIAALADRGIQAVFHYSPLHSSVAGKKFGRASGELPVTCDMADRILRLPLWIGMPDDTIAIACQTLAESAG